MLVLCHPILWDNMDSSPIRHQKINVHMHLYTHLVGKCKCSVTFCTFNYKILFEYKLLFCFKKERELSFTTSCRYRLGSLRVQIKQQMKIFTVFALAAFFCSLGVAFSSHRTMEQRLREPYYQPLPKNIYEWGELYDHIDAIEQETSDRKSHLFTEVFVCSNRYVEENSRMRSSNHFKSAPE